MESETSPVEVHEAYEAPRAEVVRVEASAQCIDTSVLIDPNPSGTIDPGDIG
ncbi:hypothetical protein VXJ25_07735 [Olsenella sp. YH-ols2223]|uniref:Uncharacterized protein n=1 Tax=Olsenella absiana TaxID=3115222 RepID=A0ABU7RBI6_9ACTN